jgi:hypothetical protein
MLAEAALLFGQPLLFFTLGAAAVHFSVAQIIRKKQSATGAFAGAGFMNNRLTARQGTFKNGFTLLAPVFTL